MVTPTLVLDNNPSEILFELTNCLRSFIGNIVGGVCDSASNITANLYDMTKGLSGKRGSKSRLVKNDGLAMGLVNGVVGMCQDLT